MAMIRACIDWPSGEGALTADVDAFLARECVEIAERYRAIALLSAGKTYTDQKRRWSLTPVPG